MIVTCPGCSANYRVRNEAVPEGGARMKCPKCNTMFLAKPPPQKAAPEAAAPSMTQDPFSAPVAQSAAFGAPGGIGAIGVPTGQFPAEAIAAALSPQALAGQFPAAPAPAPLAAPPPVGFPPADSPLGRQAPFGTPPTGAFPAAAPPTGAFPAAAPPTGAFSTP
ncbi:MAG: hypothetical protein GY822_15335, partial [Deltaproteobacteria bacterium]|nr:hypothetical protein [Deltaproteobacteria bacterium]